MPGEPNGGVQGGLLGLDWLLAGEPPLPDLPEEEEEPPPLAQAAEPSIARVEESTGATPAELTAEKLQKEHSRAVVSSPLLPAWLQGVEVETEVMEPTAPLWDEDLDFSDLPDWPGPEQEGQPAVQQSDVPEWASFEMDDPIQSPEREGTGLLIGVRGPIPIEPVIALMHEAPTFPGRDDVRTNQEAANLFARIAGGAVAPEPVTLPEAPLRGAALFHLLLILFIVLPLIFDSPLFGVPPRMAAVTSFGDTLRALPQSSTILLSFDYEAGMSDELEPAAVATLNHLRKLTEAEGEAGREIQLIVVSTTPQGMALAQIARQKSTWGEENWLDMGFLAGGSIGVREMLTQPFPTQPFATAEEKESTRRQAQVALSNLALIIVVGSDTTVVQRWVEQAGVEAPGMPMMAIAPSVAESTLTPYLASGQLDGLLAGIPSTASYEYHDLGGLVETERLVAWRRIGALTVAALLMLVVILAGNLIGAGVINLSRFRRQSQEEE
ncbi:MAG: hypothetical protein H0T73_01335 [Ardenticatenales bacterium]|nr:hypothetical protein [Ardenticatenales bacterium]